MKNSVMLCVSTFSQPANMIPIIQKKVDKVVLLTTNYSRKYTENIIDVFNGKKRKIDFDNIEVLPEIERDIRKLTDFIHNEISKYLDYKTIYLNLGGGNKPFAIAINRNFMKIKHEGIKLIYSDPNSKDIIEIDKSLNENRENINVDLTLDEILSLFGYTRFNATDKKKAKEILKISDEMMERDLKLGLFLAESYIKSDIFRKLFLIYNNKDGKLFKADDKNYIEKAINQLKPELEDLKLSDNKGYELFENLIKEKKFEEIKKVFSQKDLYSSYWNEVKKQIIKYIKKELRSINKNIYNVPILKSLTEDEITELKNIEEKANLIIGTDEKIIKFKVKENSYFRKKDIKFHKKIGDLFEDMVNAIFLNEINSNEKVKNNIYSIWTSVRTIKKENLKNNNKKNEKLKEESEYDLIIVTKFGTLVMIEAKSAKIAGDTAKSKEDGAYKKSGPYGKAAIINLDMDLLNDENGELYPWVPGFIKGLRTIVRNQGITHIKFDEVRKFLEKNFIKE